MKYMNKYYLLYTGKYHK